MHAEQFGSIANHDFGSFVQPLGSPGSASAVAISLVRFSVDDILVTRDAYDDLNHNGRPRRGRADPAGPVLHRQRHRVRSPAFVCPVPVRPPVAGRKPEADPAGPAGQHELRHGARPGAALPADRLLESGCAAGRRHHDAHLLGHGAPRDAAARVDARRSLGARPPGLARAAQHGAGPGQHVRRPYVGEPAGERRLGRRPAGRARVLDRERLRVRPGRRPPRLGRRGARGQ